MQKTLAVLSCLLFLGFLVGCGGDDPTPPATGLTISVAGSDSLSIQLNWTAAASVLSAVDGYKVYFNAAEIADVSTASYTHTNPASLGNYYVKAYTGSTLSDPTNTVSTNV